MAVSWKRVEEFLFIPIGTNRSQCFFFFELYWKCFTEKILKNRQNKLMTLLSIFISEMIAIKNLHVLIFSDILFWRSFPVL
jgi:hypothetical protein